MEREALTMAVIKVTRSDIHSFVIAVGVGSRIQLFVGE